MHNSKRIHNNNCRERNSRIFSTYHVKSFHLHIIVPKTEIKQYVIELLTAVFFRQFFISRENYHKENHHPHVNLRDRSES